MTTPTPGQPLSEADVSLLQPGDILKIDTGGGLYRFVRAKSKPSRLICAKKVEGSVERFYDRCRFTFVERPHAPVSRPGDGVEGGGGAILKGVGKINGDGWKDTTTKGEIVFVWNAEKPSPYAPGQYPRIGNEGWSASTSQYDFTPATADDVPAILSLLRPAAPSDSEMRDAISLILPLAKGYAAAHPVGSNQAYVDYVESLVSNEGDDVIRPVEPEEIKAAYQRGWNDREADIIERTERIAPQPDALAVLDRLLAHSGARGTFDAMKHGDAVKEAEALLQARRDEPGASSWPEVTDAWAETYCALTGKDPDGQQVTFVDGATVTTFRDMAKREIEAMLCAAPKAAVRAIAALTPPAEPVSRPAGEGEREAVARITGDDLHEILASFDDLTDLGGMATKINERLALLSPAAPDAGGGK